MICSIRTPKEIRSKLQPEPECEPLPPLRHNEPPSKGQHGTVALYVNQILAQISYAVLRLRARPMRSILMTPEEVRQQIFLMTPTLRAAACISLLAIAGCMTLQVSGQNKSNQKIAFFAKVGDKDKLDSEVNPFNNLVATPSAS